MTRRAFDQLLEDLHLELITMSNIVEGSINNSLLALKTKDYELAKKVISSDDEIDNMELDIEKKALNIIVSQQPMARDLRLVMCILKMITDLERLGDHATDISEIVVETDIDVDINLFNITEMGDIASSMVKHAITSYVEKDPCMADEVIKNDIKVNKYFKEIVEKAEGFMKTHPDQIHSLTSLIFIAKYIERIGDHAKNVAEWSKFNITGKHISGGHKI